MHIIDNQERKVLSEGRSTQMGFAFLNKIGTKKFETVQPISPCKDYLNDVVWVEATGQDITVYGLSYSKKKIFEGKKLAYIALKICPSQNGYGYIGWEEDKENLRNNYKNLQKFINHFDSLLGVRNTIISATSNPDIFIVTFSQSWIQNTYLISAFSLLLRLGQFWKPELGEIDTFFKSSKEIHTPDIYLRDKAYPKINKLLEKKDTKSNFKKLTGYSVHNTGIVTYET